MLLDAMCSLVVATVVMASTMTLFAATYTTSGGARQNNLAYNAARHVIENIRYGYGASVAVTASPQSATTYGPVPELSQITNGTGTVTIANYNTSGTVKCVAVTISWYDGEKTRSNTVSSLLTTGGVAP